MALGFPERNDSLKADRLAPVGLLAGCSQTTAAACLALDEIGARGWSSYGWSSEADRSRRRGWTQNRQRMGLLIAFNLMSALSNVRGVDDVQRRDGGWLNLVVLPDPAGSGCTIEVRGDLDGAMYDSVRSAVRSLFVTIVRVWDPTAP